jgi:dihydroxyacid dehydratase/phosphogluconate dehydratase
LSIGHIPEAAEVCLMALAEDGDRIKIDIPSIAEGCTTNQPGLNLQLEQPPRTRVHCLLDRSQAWR